MNLRKLSEKECIVMNLIMVEVRTHNEHVSPCGPIFLQSGLMFPMEAIIPFVNL